MTLKEKIDSFCAKEIVLHIPTKDLFIKVCDELKRRGIKWHAGIDDSPEAWDDYGEETVISFKNDRMGYCNRDYFKYSVIVEITEDDFKLKLCQDQLKEHVKKCQERSESPTDDNVNHPAYYTDGQIEVSDFIADKNLNFFRGNVVKYVTRAGKKDPSKEVEDLKKAQWYINREIERVEGKA